MKILFFIIVLANIFAALWEFRYGGTYKSRTAEQGVQEATPGLEKIKLVSEDRPDASSRQASPDAPPAEPRSGLEQAQSDEKKNNSTLP